MAAESIGTLIPTKIPGLGDAADIQAALRLYHYGSYTFDITETDKANLVSPSIAKTLSDLQDSITGFSALQPSLLTAKGALISASAASTASTLAVGTNGQVLTANSATASGLQWVTPEVTLTNTATLTNKTLTSPTITSPTITLATSSSTTDARLSWDTTNKMLQVGNGSSTVSIPSFTVNTTAKTANYTLALTDLNTMIQINGAYKITVPLNASVAFPNGAQIHLAALTTGVNVEFTSGITSYYTPGLNLRAAGSTATLIKTDTNTWILAGDLSA